MFDYQFWFGLLALVIAVYTAYLQRRQVNLSIAQPANPEESVSSPLWWKSPTVIAVFVLAALTWAPYIIAQLPSRNPTIRNLGTNIEIQSDQLGRFIDATVSIAIDGNDIYKFYPKKVMMVAFRWPSDRDVDDVQDLKKSQVLDIRRSPETFYIKIDQHLLEGGGINYAVIILPTGVAADSFTTMRQAKMEGAEILPDGSAGISVGWRRRAG